MATLSECKVGVFRITNQLSDRLDRAVHARVVSAQLAVWKPVGCTGRVLHGPGDQTADS